MKFSFPAGGILYPLFGVGKNKYKVWIMKITTLVCAIFCTGLQLVMAGDAKSQDLNEVKVTLELKNESLKSAFRKIEQQTEFRFAYNKTEVENYGTISFQKAEYSVQQALQLLLENTNLGFKTIRNNIIIFLEENKTGTDENKTNLLIKQADGSIHGRIANERGDAIAGASVLLVGTDKGTAADNAGQFTLNAVKPGKYTLQVSAVGYQNASQTITVNDGESLDLSFILKDVNAALNEVVVTGYSRQSKRDVTGAVSTISADVITKTPVADVPSALQGRAAGVSVDAQGGPGSTAVVRIRGFGTNGNNDVLYVVDGVQMRGANNFVNPNDIETITVLKDPSITSLYGAQGGNGVIVITTKTGKRGTAPKLEYNGYGSWEKPTKYPEFLTPQEYANAYWGYLKNSGLTVSNALYGSGATPVLPDYLIERSGLAVLAAAEGSADANPSLYSLSGYRILKSSKEGTDWFGSVLKQSFSNSHQLSLSGATDKSNYSLGLGYLDNQGTLIGTYFKRYSLRVNTEFRPATWLKIGENVQFSYTQSAGISNGNHNPQNMVADLYQRSNLIPVYDIAGNYSGPKDFANTAALRPGGNNPVMDQKNALDDRSGGYNAGLIGSAYIDIEPLKNLVYETKVGAQFYPYSYRFFIDTFPQNIYSSPYNRFTEGSGYSSDLRVTNKLSYEFRLKNIHRFSAFVAYEASKAKSRNSEGTVTNLYYTTVGYLNLTNGTYNPAAPMAGSNGYENSNSLFGNLNYSLMDRYLLSFVARRDGSSKFGPLNRYGNFFSYSGAWRVSKEKFMDNISWIDDCKLRAAYGENGNNAIPSDLYLDHYTLSGYINYSSYDLNGANDSAIAGAGLYQLGNPYIHWETNKTVNLGFDATLFKNKVTVSFSWFNRITKDLLAVPPITGLAGDALAPFENIMEFSNKGIELELGYNNKIGKLFYDMNFNFSTYRNNITYISDDPGAHLDGDYGTTHFTVTRSVVGRPVSSFFGYQQEGIFQSGDEYTKEGVTYYGLNATNAAGHFKFKDLNGDKKIDDNDRTFLGSPHPKFTYGYNLNLNFKNFDLGIFLQGVAGNKIFNYWRVNTLFPGGQLKGADDTWSPTNTDAKLPIWNNNTSDDIKPSSFFVEDGSYLRLKSLQLGYTIIPDSKIFSRLRMYVQGYNLATFTKYSGIDPEITTGNATNFGVDFGGNYPISRKIVVGINFGL